LGRIRLGDKCVTNKHDVYTKYHVSRVEGENHEVII